MVAHEICYHTYWLGFRFDGLHKNVWDIIAVQCDVHQVLGEGKKCWRLGEMDSITGSQS